MLFGVSVVAVVAGVLAAVFVGWLWYGVVFAKPWTAGHGLPPNPPKPSPAPYIVNVVGWLAANIVFGSVMAHFPGAGLGLHVGMAALLWLGFTLPFMATNATFLDRKPQVIAIDAGYPLVGLLLAGVAHALLG